MGKAPVHTGPNSALLNLTAIFIEVILQDLKSESVHYCH